MREPHDDELVTKLRAEITRLLADALDETRTRTYRDQCARRIPHVQARLLVDALDRHREPHSGTDTTSARDEHAGTAENG